jgi:protein SPA2
MNPVTNITPLVPRPSARASQDTQASRSSRRKPSDDLAYRSQRQSEDPYGGVGSDDGLAYGSSRRQGSIDGNASNYSNGRRKPSRDDTRAMGTDRRKPSRDIDPPSSFRPVGGDRRRPSVDTTGGRSRGQDGSSDAGSSVSGGAAATAVRDEIVPTKSTITEEEIEIPFGREGRDSALVDDDTPRRQRSGGLNDDDFDSAMSPRTPAMGLSGLVDLGLRLGEISPDDVRQRRRGSDTSDGGVTPLVANRSRPGSEADKARIATLENQVRSLENEVDVAAERALRSDSSSTRVAQLEKELELFRQVRSLLYIYGMHNNNECIRKQRNKVMPCGRYKTISTTQLKLVNRLLSKLPKTLTISKCCASKFRIVVVRYNI